MRDAFDECLGQRNVLPVLTGAGAQVRAGGAGAPSPEPEAAGRVRGWDGGAPDTPILAFFDMQARDIEAGV